MKGETMSCENSTMEFKSKLEEIMPAKELLFDPTPSFGKYKPFLEHAIAHPAKMNTELLTFLILEFTKPGGLAIIVIKPFIRNKKVIDLPYHTWLLMEKVGFKLEKLYKLRLKQQSFWRILYYKKFSNIPKISHEYILICKKP